MKDYMHKIKNLVQKHGWICQAVFHGEDLPAFSYTVGLVETFNHPEILVVGLEPELARKLLGICVRAIKMIGALPLHEPVPNILQAPFAPLFTRVTEVCRKDYMKVARAYYNRDDVDTIMMLLPDKQGVYPHQKQFKNAVEHVIAASVDLH